MGNTAEIHCFAFGFPLIYTSQRACTRSKKKVSRFEEIKKFENMKKSRFICSVETERARNEAFKYSTHALTFFLDCVDIKHKREKCVFCFAPMFSLSRREIKASRNGGASNKFIWFYYLEGRKSVAHIRTCVAR